VIQKKNWFGKRTESADNVYVFVFLRMIEKPVIYPVGFLRMVF